MKRKCAHFCAAHALKGIEKATGAQKRLWLYGFYIN